MVGFTGGEAKQISRIGGHGMRRMDRKNRINKIRNNTACLNHKNAWKDMKTAVIKTVGAALFGITVLGAARMTPYAFNIGPGMEDHDIIYYQEQPENNPAYNNGWTSNVGPGASGSNPGGGLGSEKDYVYSKGPGNEAAQQYAKTENSTIYIHNTYRGGSWRQRADGKWALYKPDGNPVSSQWGYVDGKTYLLDMYGIMQTGWQNVNGNWYYLNSKGAMQTGWLLKEGKYYFLNTDGTMAYGWVNSQGSWYYFQKPNGDMLTNAYAPDGRYVNAEGVLIQ